ncbi:hypothetical protein H4F31_24160, partial [Escherichia coli]|nr:hypothetical protein [Escherichia coli]
MFNHLRNVITGFVMFMGMASSSSTVLIDSFRYIPPGMDESDCELYESVFESTTEITTETTTEVTTETITEFTTMTTEVITVEPTTGSTTATENEATTDFTQSTELPTTPSISED